MAKRLQYRRLLILVVLLVAAFAGLGYRLVDLQVLRHDELATKSQQNTQREFLIEPRRGDIVDVRGNPLATSIFMKVVFADPQLIGNHRAEVAHAVAPLLQMNESDLFQHLLPRIRQNEKGETVTNRSVLLKRKVPVETWQQITNAMGNLTFGVDEKKLAKKDRAFLDELRRKALYTENYPMRVYPNQTLAAHVLGFASTEETVVNSNSVFAISGKDGIELTMNSKLDGVRGWRLTETDHRGREVVSMRAEDVEPRDGMKVALTIDSVIQQIVESALAEAMEKYAPISACALVVRPHTGEILAMATLPEFDPNDPGAPGTTADARRNRNVADVMEPGSTFKIVVVSGALNDKTVTLDDVFDCEHGHFTYAGRTLHDHESYGMLTVEQIITKSSNIGAAKIGIKMGENRLYDYICGYGFGARTGLPLPGEVPGIVHSVTNWSKVSVAQIPMGQGIAVTRLQLTMAMCAIANQGRLMCPMLVDHLEDQKGNIVAKYSPQFVRQVISESSNKLMIEALKTVVGAEGTAPKAALEHYTVAGKTGTAQKVEGGVYDHEKFVASFVGFFPADKPEVCISVVMDEPDRSKGYYGGQVAAPVFKEIAEHTANYLNIRPDIGDSSAPEPLAGHKDSDSEKGRRVAAAKTTAKD
jgi:cell division protein FtsI/penicillin-binding protein 2